MVLPKNALEWEMHRKAVIRNYKKEFKASSLDNGLLAEYRNKQPTLENLYSFTEKSVGTTKGHRTRTYYLIDCLTKNPAERRFIKKVNRACWTLAENDVQGFAVALIESVERKQKITKAQAKETLSRNLKKLIQKIDENASQLLRVATSMEAMANHPHEAAQVRHDLGDRVEIILGQLQKLAKAIAEA